MAPWPGCQFRHHVRDCTYYLLLISVRNRGPSSFEPLPSLISLVVNDAGLHSPLRAGGNHLVYPGRELFPDNSRTMNAR